MGVIYLRTNKVNGKQYVGQTSNLEIRQKNWKNLSKKYAGTAINRARSKYGIDNFGFEILKECNDNELDYWETYYINELNTKTPYGYNMTDGGDGTSGCPCSEEAKKKIGDKNRGKKHSEEAKKKTSIKLKGKRKTEEHKKHISESHKGKKRPPFTEEWKKKLSEKQKGVYNTIISKPVLQLDKNSNEVIAEFPSTAEVERKLGFNHSFISECCRGVNRHKTAYGFKWKYKEESAA